MNQQETSAFDRLNTFSWEWDENTTANKTEDYELREIFSYDDTWLKLLLDPQDDERGSNSMIQSRPSYLPSIITPEKVQASAVDISIDPIPISQIHPLLVNNEEVLSKLKGEESTLLFPSVQHEEDSYLGYRGQGFADLDYVPLATLNKNHSQKPVDKKCVFSEHPLHSEIYGLLKPSLPLQKEFRSILCLLLCMESSSTVEKLILKNACEILNETLTEALSQAANGLSRESSSLTLDAISVSGKIVDEWVEQFGHLIDLAKLFIESAKLSKRLAATSENCLSIFFEAENARFLFSEQKFEGEDDSSTQVSLIHEASLSSIGNRKRKERNFNAFRADEDDCNTSGQKRICYRF